jgi:GTP-binding protein Era
LTPDNYKSGFVSIIGKPNAGKSTLLNALLGQKLSIMTPKAQTTRQRIRGIDNGDDYQIVYSDTPGVIRPKYKLHERMMGAVGNALEDADVLILLIAADETFPEEDIVELAKKVKVPKILAMNKTDIVKPEEVQRRIADLTGKIDFEEILDISALKDIHLDKLKDLILKYLPFSPPYYDPEELSDKPERFFVAEMIREQIFILMQDEIPYSCQPVVVQFKDEGKIIRISVDIHVERQSQKGMLIGKGGSMLKQIGTNGRKEIETFLDKKVFLELYVKVTEDWKESNFHLKNFGY